MHNISCNTRLKPHHYDDPIKWRPIVSERNSGALLVRCGNHVQHLRLPNLISAVQDEGPRGQNLFTGRFYFVVVVVAVVVVVLFAVAVVVADAAVVVASAVVAAVVAGIAVF